MAVSSSRRYTSVVTHTTNCYSTDHELDIATHRQLPILIDASVAGDALVDILILHTENDIFPHLSILYVACMPII
jgi:hypothetical protein